MKGYEASRDECCEDDAERKRDGAIDDEPIREFVSLLCNAWSGKLVKC
jgi:hypothetical protein